MSTIQKVTLRLLAATAAVLCFSAGAQAQFKWTGDYKNLYNEKVAIELELKSVKNQFANEKSNYETRISQLEGDIENLNKKLDMCNRQKDEESKLCADRIKELEGTINVLQKKGSDQEKNLIEENKKMQARYEAELAKALQELKAEREKYIRDMDAQRKQYETKINELNAQLAARNNEMANLQKLTQQQKAELERMERQADELEKQLQDEIQKGQIRLKKMFGKLIINIDDRISFDSGSAELKKEIFPALDKITKILADYPEYTIMIEGHTDNVPIKTRQFRDNWQLSTERALSVLGYILKNQSINRSRFAAAGYGEYNPIVSNDTAANRSLNRRVDIVVVPRVTQK